MESNRNNKTTCLSCFGELGGDRVCTTCKQKADDTPSPSHHIAARTVLHKKYLLCKAIGEGGFGITYLAWRMTDGVKVAIKELFPNAYVYRTPRSNCLQLKDKANLIANTKCINRFMHEAKTLASLKNTAGIVDVLDFFNTNKTSYIVMEYLEGLQLKLVHKQKGNLKFDELYQMLLPIFDGLQSVHQKGLIHRDISPDNIIITKNGAKLVDFGASKRLNYHDNSMSIVLKHGFAPEEQYRKHGEQGPWSDVYALACTMYFCLVGKLPPESIQRLYKDNIIPPSNMNAVISKSQEIALMRALSVYSKNRYQSILEFNQALQKSKLKQIVKPESNTKDTIKSIYNNKNLDNSNIDDVPTTRRHSNFYSNLLGQKKK